MYTKSTVNHFLFLIITIESPSSSYNAHIQTVILKLIIPGTSFLVPTFWYRLSGTNFLQVCSNFLEPTFKHFYNITIRVKINTGLNFGQLIRNKGNISNLDHGNQIYLNSQALFSSCNHR